ncbi:MAG: type III-A CRISPR-associated protein Cas10/Csm1 [Deltaproteobacteria bacterium]|nr:MAG: type III-A CRISPR-associated protein Cas10/Csm1 [Deltaproteobacteria bacterium]
MDHTTLKVLTGGFLHDIGKVVGRNWLDIDDDYVKRHENIFLPLYRGRYSHHHAIYSGAFIEKMKEYLPPEFNTAEWGDGDPLFNLVAGHHNPSTSLQWIIAVADRISSGMDRDVFEDNENDKIPFHDYRKTRLFPVFEEILAKEKTYTSPQDFQYRYRLAVQSPSSIFPVKVGDMKRGETSALEDYRELVEGFISGIKKLENHNDDLSLWLEHFDSLMMAYMSQVPAARVGNVVPDVSLYDHSRMSAALAAALYLFHRDTESLEERAIKDNSMVKFLVISGDLYGIQDFIFKGYGDTRKYRSKLLRGRSFYVSLLSELAADLYCRKIGLHCLSVILSAAGKFMIIAPRTENALETLKEVDEEINEWLCNVAYGEVSIGITSVEASQGDFINGNFQKLWDRIAEKMEERKYSKLNLSRWGGAVTGYLDDFRNDLASPLCPICGKRPSSPQVEGSLYVGEDASACNLCRDQIFLGTQIVKNSRIAILKDIDTGRESMQLVFPIFDRYQVAFIDAGIKDYVKRGELLRYWDISAWKNSEITSEVTVKMINGYVPVYGEEDEKDDRLLWSKKGEKKKLEYIEQIVPGDPKTFGHIASKSLVSDAKKDGYTGVDALGVLKADVDNLGMLMGCGLKPERFTISRLATLSRQLNTFFSCYLPKLLEGNKKFKDVYTVFAGGDDLFLIGPWNCMLELGEKIVEEFSRYTCHNPAIHLSAGIVFCKPNVPLDTMARQAEEALEASKTGNKNRVCIFGEVIPWGNICQLRKIEEELEGWLNERILTRSMLYELNDLIKMASLEKLLRTRKEVHIEYMEALKWRALLAYFARRNVANKLMGESRKKVVEEITMHLVAWLDEYGGWLRVPLWNILYNTR